MKMAKGSRDWTQIYAIYGMDEYQTFLFILIHALFFTLLSLLTLLYFTPITTTLSSLHLFTLLPPGSPRFTTGLLGSITSLISITLIYSAGNFLYSAVPLRWEISQRMISAIPDWCTVRTALDLGCGRGILLNAVAMQLKKQGSSGRVVGLDRTRPETMRALRTAGVEGVQEYVTCREGDVRRLPEYVRKLKEMRMEEIRVSERVTAYMVSSQIVWFRKPREMQMVNLQDDLVGTVYAYAGEVRLDWRCHNLC